jgi:hypothetical protein
MTLAYTYSDTPKVANPLAWLMGYTSTREADSVFVPESDNETLTVFCMAMSQSSLNDVWENEEDGYWESIPTEE